MTVICHAIAHKSFDMPIGYGISVFRRDTHNQPFENIKDAFLDAETAERFCQMINENDVDELHFHDILEDTLAIC